MYITRTSLLSNITRTLDLPITKEQLDEYHKGEGLIQNIFPNLTADEREFIMTGCIPEEWDDAFLEDEYEELDEDEVYYTYALQGFNQEDAYDDEVPF